MTTLSQPTAALQTTVSPLLDPLTSRRSLSNVKGATTLSPPPLSLSQPVVENSVDMLTMDSESQPFPPSVDSVSMDISDTESLSVAQTKPVSGSSKVPEHNAEDDTPAPENTASSAADGTAQSKRPETPAKVFSIFMKRDPASAAADTSDASNKAPTEEASPAPSASKKRKRRRYVFFFFFRFPTTYYFLLQ